MEQTPSPQVSVIKSTKRNKALTIIPWVGLVLFIITAALAGYLYATKQMAFAFGSTATGANTTASAAVCGESVINTYNLAMHYQYRDSTTEQTLDEAGLNDLEKQIPAKNGYAQDPTCQTILFWIAIHHNDATKAKAALTALNDLHSKGKYVDSNLSNNSALSTFQDTIDGLSVGAQG